jgi:spermidine synthase
MRMTALSEAFLQAIQEVGRASGTLPEGADLEVVGGHSVPYVLTTPTSKSLHFSFVAVQSRMDLNQPELLALDYTRTMMGFLLFQARPQAIAMIGLGGGSLARFIHRHLPDSYLKVVEINPEVLSLRDEFLIPDDGERFRVRLGDGAEFVQQPPRLFDVLLVDGFDVTGQPPELASLSFYEDCAKALQPEGVAVINLCPVYLGYERQLEDLHTAFEGHVLVVGDRDSANAVVFASRTPLRQLYDAHGWRALGALPEKARRQLQKSLARVSRAVAKAGA